MKGRQNYINSCEIKWNVTWLIHGFSHYVIPLQRQWTPCSQRLMILFHTCVNNQHIHLKKLSYDFSALLKTLWYKEASLKWTPGAGLMVQICVQFILLWIPITLTFIILGLQFMLSPPGHVSQKHTAKPLTPKLKSGQQPHSMVSTGFKYLFLYYRGQIFLI